MIKELDLDLLRQLDGHMSPLSRACLKIAIAVTNGEGVHLGADEANAIVAEGELVYDILEREIYAAMDGEEMVANEQEFGYSFWVVRADSEEDRTK